MTDDMLTCGSLFAGIGGFDLGLERAGMRTLWFAEQDLFCRRVLARHWPGVPCHPDVRALVADAGGARRRQDVRGAHGDEGADAGRREADPDVAGGGGEGNGAGPVVSVPVPHRFWTPEDGEYTIVARPDVLCGGFPCQDISLAGRGAGLAGERSGLWREFARLIGELRPRYVIVENVPALTSRGLDVVLADLAACGFDAEWDHLPASAFGAPHRRDRIWLVAYPDDSWERPEPVDADARVGAPQSSGQRRNGSVGHPDDPRLEGRRGHDERPDERPARSAGAGTDRGGREPQSGLGGMADGLSHWLHEPDVGRVATGVPQRVDRLRALGNALVPQIAEYIGRRIIEWEGVMPDVR